MSKKTSTNYYSLLGVEPDATAKEIKHAYWKLAGEHHPDRGGDEAVFKGVSDAYEVLSDPDRRSFYDQNGTIEGFKNDDELAREKICILVGTIINRSDFMADHTDLIRALRGEINEISISINNEISNQKIILRRYNAVIDRISNAEYIHSFMVESKTRVENNIEELEKDLEIQELMHDLLEDACYNFELDKEMPNGQDNKICEEEEGQEIRPV